MLSASHTPTLRHLNKVPMVTAMFWLIKMMSTTVGETAADFLSADLSFGLEGTAMVTGALLAAALFAQIRAPRHIPWLYWVSVALISVFGTLVTDIMTDTLGIPLSASTLGFGLALLCTFAIWYQQERTLSILAIDSVKRELFYWAAIFVTFAMGTASGDWLAEGLSLGYRNAALLFAAAIAVTALARWVLKANAIACFWVAYVLTRPLGAACGDLLSQPLANGGLGLGTVTTSVVFAITITGAIAYLSMRPQQPNGQA